MMLRRQVVRCALSRAILTITPQETRNVLHAHHFHLRYASNAAKSQVIKPKRSDAKKTTHEQSRISDDWQQAVAYFDQKINLHGKDANITSNEVYQIIKACNNHGRHRQAKSVLRLAKKMQIEITPPTEALMVSLIAHKGTAERALEYLQTLLKSVPRDEPSTVHLFDPLITVLKTKHDWQNIRRVIQMMDDFGIEPPMRVFRVFMIATAKAKRKDLLLTTVAFVEGKFQTTPMDLPTLTAMCQALNEVGEYRKILDIYHTMDQQWLEAHGSTILFNNFVLAALRKGRMNKAIEILERMKVSTTYAPDDFTFAMCILELEKMREWAQVIRIFNDMQDREIRGISNHYAINALSCGAVVRAIHCQGNEDSDTISKRDKQKDMRIVLQRLDNLSVSNFGHTSSLIDRLEENGYRHQALALFQRMVNEDVVKAPLWLRQDGFEIDLHHFSLGVAKCAVVHAFQNIRARQHLRKVEDVRIITGIGKHSRAKLKPVMPKEVSELLIRHFRPLIRPIAHPTNPGMSLVRTKAVQAWLDGGGSIRSFEFE